MSWSYGMPEHGKFVALYDDGDGAAFFRWDDDGTLFDGKGYVLGTFDGVALLAYLAESGFYGWQALPEGFVMFWEAV
jgi:hypothetical protein